MSSFCCYIICMQAKGVIVPEEKTPFITSVLGNTCALLVCINNAPCFLYILAWKITFMCYALCCSFETLLL